MCERRKRIQKDHRSSLCRRHASTIRKVAFSFWSLGPSRLVPDRPRALRELDQRRSVKNCQISTAPLEESDENQGRVSAPLRSFAENRSATPGGDGVGVPSSLILSLLSSLTLSLSLSFSFSSSHAEDSPATGMPSSGASLIGFQTYFQLVP